MVYNSCGVAQPTAVQVGVEDMCRETLHLWTGEGLDMMPFGL
jgi:hypothetical protein